LERKNALNTRKKIIINLLGFFFILLITDVHGNSSSYCNNEIREVKESSMVPGFLPKKHRDIAGFLVGRDSFKVAKSVFGDAKIWESGDASEAESKVCYFVKNKHTNIIVVISSSSEMSNGMIDALALIQGDVDFQDHCKESKVRAMELHTKSGIYIGMSLSKFKSIMGEPSVAKRNSLLYEFYHKKELRQDERGYSFCLVDGKSVAVRFSGISACFIAGKL
jgi:hypothetical protein